MKKAYANTLTFVLSPAFSDIMKGIVVIYIIGVLR